MGSIAQIFVVTANGRQYGKWGAAPRGMGIRATGSRPNRGALDGFRHRWLHAGALRQGRQED
jgi:hypothetical protein